MPDADADELCWLTSDAAEPWLRVAAEMVDEPLAASTRLRRELSATRAALVVEQATLRRRARCKFAAADRLFFTARGLEQATDETIAGYKQQRFADRGAVADLCCGIGGDLISLAAGRPSVGVERDAATAMLAAANLAAARHSSGDASADASRVVCDDATRFDLAGCGAWHIDPDRRPTGKRTTRVSLHEPDAATIDALRRHNADAAIKLAPATDVPEHWADEAELEWIGHDRQCQQFVAWFGGLATQRGMRRATVLDASHSHTFVGTRGVPLPAARDIGRFVYEPHAALLAADLWGDLAARRGLEAVEPRIAYLTADACLDDPLLARFEVLDVLPFRVPRLQAALRQRRGGRLEIKKRGVDVDPAALRRQLAVEGDEPLTVLVTRRGRKTIAIIARRSNDMPS